MVPAGSRRERPRTGTIDLVGAAEIWVAVPGEWWILCGYMDETRSLIGFKVHASAPFEAPGSDDEITWVDLDLDFEVSGNQLALLDEDEFHDHARTMAYPDHVVRGAWSGIARWPRGTPTATGRLTDRSSKWVDSAAEPWA